MTSDLMLAIKTIIIVSPNWRNVLKLFRQTEVRCAMAIASLAYFSHIRLSVVFVIQACCLSVVFIFHSRVLSFSRVLSVVLSFSRVRVSSTRWMRNSLRC